MTAPAELETAIELAIDEVAARTITDPRAASTVPAADAEQLMARFNIGSPAELALLALPVARRLARPPISGYHVAVVGVEAETGDLILGGNLEFPGTELSTTIHAEGFVALRARRRGHTLATLALIAAHPCAHCRQVLSESAAADQLVLVDLEGARLRMDDVYPWPFRPDALGLVGDQPGRVNWPGLAFADAPSHDTPPADVAGPLLEAGTLAHAPYSGTPSAAVVRVRDGRTFSAGCLESVSFNPSIGALQAAIVEVAAARVAPAEITDGWLGAVEGGAIDPEPGFRSLLAAVAPGATAHVARWRTGA